MAHYSTKWAKEWIYMKKLYEVTVHTKEQQGLEGVCFFKDTQVLDTEKDLENQIREMYLNNYDITIVEIEYNEVKFNRYNIIVEEKSGYVIVLHNCKNGVERSESKLFEEKPSDSLVQSFIDHFGAESATIEER